MGGLRKTGAGIAIAILVTFSAAAQAAAPSGSVVAVVQSAEADGASGRKILEVQGPVFKGDRIVTGAIGEAQIKFRDDTKLVVGPNSVVVIDAFVFSDDNSARAISMNAVKGAFRFITGKSRKDAYTITTPTATIGVRGTVFDFNVDGRGTRVAVFTGSTVVCDRQRRNCVVQTGGCALTQVDRGAAPRKISDLVDRARALRDFRYVASQASLRSEFRAGIGACRMDRAAVSTPAGPVLALTNEPPPPPPDTPDPPKPTHANHSGLGDGTNPGKGDGRQNSPNNGTNNPGGGD